MATYKVSAMIVDSTNSPNITIGKSNVEITGTGTHEDRRTVEVGTSEETYTLSTDIGDAGMIYIENLDSTNFVQLGFATSTYYIRLDPGEPNKFRLEPTVSQLFMKADTAACDVRFHVLED